MPLVLYTDPNTPISDVFIDLSPLLKLTTIGFRLNPAHITPVAVARAIESAASDVLDIQLTFVYHKDGK